MTLIEIWLSVTSLGKKGGKKGKLGPAVEKRVLPVETDAEKLVNYVCGSNILKEGENIKLAPDSEYPEWLWSLKTGQLIFIKRNNSSLFITVYFFFF